MTPKTRRVKITVTREDIAKGEATRHMTVRPHCCPVARAVQRACEDTELKVWEHGVYRSHGDDIAQLPKKAGNFVVRFDDGKPVKPFTFTLRMP